METPPSFGGVFVVMNAVDIAKIKDIDTFDPSKVSDGGLVADHRLTHIWWAELKKGNEVLVHEKPLSQKRCRALHAGIVAEMDKRGMKHDSVLKRLTDPVLVVPHFVSIVGSAVQSADEVLAIKAGGNGSKPGDVDLLYRLEACDHNAGLIEGLTILMRKEVDPGKSGKPELHHVFSASGPHSDYVPLYDLVLRPVEERAVVTLKKAGPVRLNLGCGKEKLDGYVNIDARADVKPDVVHDLSQGIPWPDGSVDEVRAWHFLEHLEDQVAIMGEIWRVLKSGGVLAFEVPSTQGEGAFADPTHKSYWNKLSFQFYADPKLREEAGTTAEFEILDLEEETFEEPGLWETVHVRGRLRAVKPTTKALTADSPSGMALQAEDLEKVALKPFGKWIPPKPAVAEYTEFLSSSELWDHWAKDRIAGGLDVEVKFNGYRTVVQKAGGRVEIAFENIRDRAKVFPDLAKMLLAIPGDYILDCDMGMVRDGKRLPRTELDPLLADEPDLAGATVVLTVFDLPYREEDLHEKPWTERRTALEEFYAKNLKGKAAFAITSTTIVHDRAQMNAAILKASAVAMSEGAMVKTLDGPYGIGGSTNEWSKVKHVTELKVTVIDSKDNAGGSKTYTCGLLHGRDSYTNLQEYDGREYIDVGGVSDNGTYPLGAVLTVQVQELVSGPDKDGKPILYWVVPTVIDRDISRKDAYYANQAVDIARRAHVLQEPKQKVQTSGQVTCPEIADADFELLEVPDIGLIHLLKQGEGESRGERFLRLWETDWQRMWPPSGTGQFVYHHHYMGIKEEDAGKSEADLRKAGYRYHGDLRCQFSPKLMFHPVIFKPDTDDDGTDEFLAADHAPSFQCTWYGPPPVEWLKVGRGKPAVFKPGEAGASSKTYGMLFAVAYGTWDMGVWHRHSFELFLKDEKGDMKGRLVISSVPRPTGERFWLAQWPEDETPVADTKTLDEVADERRKRGDHWLVWAKPGEKPKLVDLKAKAVESRIVLKMLIIKAVEEEHLVYGPVLKPWPYIDLQDEVVKAEEIRKAAHGFMERFQQIGVMHVYDDPRLRVVESYLAPTDFELEGTDGKLHKVVKGTWILGVRVNDPREWERVKKGERTGFSIEGRARRIPRKRSEIK